MWSVLVVEDDAAFAVELADEVAKPLADEARFTFASDVQSARDAARAAPPDLVLMDVGLPLAPGGPPDPRGGIQLLAELPTLAPGALVLVLSGQDRRQAVDMLLSRRVDAYMFKDEKLEEVRAHLERAFERLAVNRARKLLKAGVDRSVATPMVAAGPAMQRIVSQAEQVAARNTSVLIGGESGTGKEVLARLVHTRSARASGPFVALCCAAIPEGLAEVELFGAAKGSYTGQDGAREGVMSLARGGTLFLDEIGELPLSLQPKLLRALQERVYRPVGAKAEVPADFRLVCATHRDLAAAVGAGTFREDLYYRIQVFTLRLPSLRERPEDVEPLVAHYIQHFNREMGRRIRGATPAALERLRTHRWPGNVRELGNAIEYAFVLEPGDELTPESLPPLGGAPAAPSEEGLTFDQAQEAWERDYLRRALARSDNHLARTAEAIGLPKRTLQHRMAKLGLRIREG